MSLELYADHNLDRAIVEGLRARGFDVLMAIEDGFDQRTDEEIFERATALARMVLTNDRDSSLSHIGGSVTVTALPD